VYQAAEGEKVVITGSEVVKNWIKESGNVWKVEVPNSLFGDFNPFAREHDHGSFYNSTYRADD